MVVVDDASDVYRRAIDDNGDVRVGYYVDGNYGDDVERFGGYEDEETWREMMVGKDFDVTQQQQRMRVQDVPLSFVRVPQIMPVWGAARGEVESVGVTRRVNSDVRIGTVDDDESNERRIAVCGRRRIAGRRPTESSYDDDDDDEDDEDEKHH